MRTTLTSILATMSGVVCGAMGAGCAPAPREVVRGADELFQLHDARAMRASSCNPDWRTANRDSRPIEPGETLTIADVDGPGVIRHIWFTINAEDPRYGRSLTLRMYWDGQAEPAVESPIADFFAVGHGMKRQVDSATVSVTSEGRAFNCYWPMPFAKHARITLTNDSKVYKARSVFFYVDYERVPQLPPDTAFFHAQYRQEFPTQPGKNYLILDAEGSGQYVGTVLCVIGRTGGWFGEGDDFFFVDGEAEPSLRGTGTEDYFCDAWGFREFNRPYYGVVQLDGHDVGDRLSVYRWHIKDPVRFNKSLRVEIEHKGVMFDTNRKRVSGYHERQDLYSSVAFWYQTGKARRFSTVPPVDERMVPEVSVEIEDSRSSAKPLPADTRLEAAPSGMFGGGASLLSRFSGEKSSLTVPFTLKSDAMGVVRVRLAASGESGIWSAALDGTTFTDGIDLYAPALAAREVRVGMAELKAGEHVLTFECKGKNPQSSGYLLGVDQLWIDAVTPYAVPAQ